MPASAATYEHVLAHASANGWLHVYSDEHEQRDQGRPIADVFLTETGKLVRVRRETRHDGPFLTLDSLERIDGTCPPSPATVDRGTGG